MVGVRLMNEMLDHAPASWTPSERLVVVAIAEQANDVTRRGYPGIDLIAHRVGVDVGTISRTLNRLRKKGTEIRVPMDGVGAADKPVYAVRGHRTVYLIPRLCQRPTHSTRGCVERADGGPAIEPPEAPERADERQAISTESPDGGPTKLGERADGGPERADGGPAHPLSSPQKPSPQANGSTAAASAKRDWSRVDDNDRREDADIQKLAEPLRTVALSLADSDPDASIDEARAVHRLVAQQAMDAGNPIKGVKYYTTIAERGGFSVHLANVRARRLTDEKDAVESAKMAMKEAIAKLRETEPDCEHGTAAGAALHPKNGTALCPQCRRGIAAIPEQVSRSSDSTSGVVSAYQATWVDAGHGPIEMTTLGAISTEARRMFAAGYPLDQLITYAKAAAAARQTLAYAARKLQEAPL